MAEEEEQEEEPPGVSESESALTLWRLTSRLFSSWLSWSLRRDCLGRESGSARELSAGGCSSGVGGLCRSTVRGLATGGEAAGLGAVCQHGRGFGVGGGSSGSWPSGVGGFVGVFDP